MKRLLLMMAAVASVTAAVPLAPVAFARDGDQGRGAQRHERGPDNGRGPSADRGGRRYDGPRRGGEDRGRPDGDRGGRRYEDSRRGSVPALGYGDERRGRRYEEDRPRYEDRQRGDERPRYGYGGNAPRPQGFAPPPSARRGGYLPRNFSGEIVDDYRRFRLRTPPAGFAWVRVGNGFALVSMSDGQIFDMVQ